MSSTELDAAFVFAVRGHSSEKVQELLEAGASVDTPIPYTWTSGDCDWDIETTALMYAVRRNDAAMHCVNELQRLLVKNLNWNKPSLGFHNSS